jgi:glutathione S-transferase
MPHTVQTVLYSFRRCPYAIRARLALHASRVSYEHREIVLKNKPDHMLALSPKGTVPVLWISDPVRDRVMDQSLDIMLWALAQDDPQGWLPASPEDMGTALAWIRANDGAFKQHLDRYKYPHRFELTSGIQDRERGRTFLGQINTHLQATGFLHGDHWGLTDAALAPFVRQFAQVDPHWFFEQDWSDLIVWLNGFENSPIFQKVMEKIPLWQPPTMIE